MHANNILVIFSEYLLSCPRPLGLVRKHHPRLGLGRRRGTTQEVTRGHHILLGPGRLDRGRCRGRWRGQRGRIVDEGVSRRWESLVLHGLGSRMRGGGLRLRGEAASAAVAGSIGGRGGVAVSGGVGGGGDAAATAAGRDALKEQMGHQSEKLDATDISSNA